MLRVEVRNRIIGTIREEHPSNVRIDLLNESLTVGELVALAVEAQIHDLLIHQKLDTHKAQEILHRQYLTEADVDEQSKQGVVKHPSEKTQKTINVRKEVAKAYQGFQQSIYIIIIDGRQVEKLDEVVTLTAQSKIAFVRLMPLVGG